MSKRPIIFALVCILLFSTMGQAYGSSTYSITTASNSIKIESPAYGSNMRIMVEKGNEKYYYSLNNPQESIPTQLGEGSYLVKILQNTTGNSYKVVEKSTIKITGNNLLDVYLSSNQPVYWEGKESVIQLAKTLTVDKASDKEKVETIYNYIINSVKYDYEKISNISSDYVPDLETVLKDKKGICYDYASLFAGMLRSLGIHTKLVKGYKNDLKEYHAWNEVLIDGKWIIIDTTYDAALKKGNKVTSIYKSLEEYTKIREY